MLIDLEEAWNALDGATLATSRPYYPSDGRADRRRCQMAAYTDT